mgnify:CR=1 FL=1
MDSLMYCHFLMENLKNNRLRVKSKGFRPEKQGYFILLIIVYLD